MSNAGLIAQINALCNDYPEAKQAGLQIILEAAKNNAPVKTGNLRDSGHLDGDAVTFDAPYARFVEYGTRYMSAQPFLRPAIDNNEQEILQAMAEFIEGDMRERIK